MYINSSKGLYDPNNYYFSNFLKATQFELYATKFGGENIIVLILII